MASKDRLKGRAGKYANGKGDHPNDEAMKEETLSIEGSLYQRFPYFRCSLFRHLSRV